MGLLSLLLYILAAIIFGLSVTILVMHITGRMPKFIEKRERLRKLINESGAFLSLMGVLFALILTLGTIMLSNQTQMIANQREMITILKQIIELLHKMRGSLAH